MVKGYILLFRAGTQYTLMGDLHHVIMETISCSYSTNSPQTHCALSAVRLYKRKINLSAAFTTNVLHGDSGDGLEMKYGGLVCAPC